MGNVLAYPLEVAKKAAKDRGGECLTHSFHTGTHPFFRFRCERAHTWVASAEKVIAGAWCPRCKRVDRHFLNLKKVVEGRGGRILSPFKNSRTPFEFECDKGHRAKARSTNIMRGGWCKKCFFLKASRTIEQMQALAKKKGGECLSSEYINVMTPLTWRCKKGHEWKTTPNGISKGKWCPKCAGVQRRTIEEMQEIAHMRGGKCLSSSYDNGRRKLLWRCAKGHDWEAVPANVVQGAWCNICSREHMRLTLSDLKGIAALRGGRCLANAYVNSRQYVRWECEKGHTWLAQIKTVTRRSWCPQCAKRGPRVK